MDLRNYQIQAINETWNALIKNDDPVLLEMSVGAGKSYVIGSIAKKFEDAQKRVLCLVNNSELVRNNSQAFKELGGMPSIFCSSLKLKEHDKNIIFATPQSIMSALKKNHAIGKIDFNMIIVDEAHGINYKLKSSIFMRILRHYKQKYKSMRLLGLTGTAFRNSEAIVGENALFKTQVGNISTQYLINHDFLVPPIFGITESEGFDFSKCKIKNTGEFNSRDLQSVINSKKRMTWQILQEVQRIMENRDVCMVFCSTIPHCHEAMEALPKDQARIIIGETDDPSRHEALTLAREKKIKYLVSVACLLTGVNVPAINCIAWLRPTSSLLLYIQGIGRGLRLNEGKTDCLVLDFAGNTTRFQDIDDPIINAALQPREENEKDYIIPCLCCGTLNTVHARRCIGLVSDKRCSNYFTWKDCDGCGGRNDLTARICVHCRGELIDPNEKLSLKPSKLDRELFTIKSAKYWVLDNTFPCFQVKYTTTTGILIYESFTIKDERSKNIFYGSFVKPCVEDSSKYYPVLKSIYHLRAMLQEIRTPHQIECTFKEDRYRTLKRHFLDSDIPESS